MNIKDIFMIIGLIAMLFGLILIAYGFFVGPFTVFVPLGFLISLPFAWYSIIDDLRK